MKLYPPNPKRIYSVPNLVGDWGVQMKLDGHRAVLECFDGKLEIYGKHGEFPLAASRGFDWSWIREIFGDSFILDGEILGPRQAGEPNNRLCVWDAAWLDGADLTQHNYRERYAKVLTASLVTPEPDPFAEFGILPIARYRGMSLFLSHNLPACVWEELWNEPHCPDQEGLVFKRMDHHLSWSMRSNQESFNMLKMKWR